MKVRRKERSRLGETEAPKGHSTRHLESSGHPYNSFCKAEWEKSEFLQVQCPECGSSRVWKNGTRRDGTQRFLCKDCGYRFSFRHNNSKKQKAIGDSGKSAKCSGHYTPKNLLGLRAMSVEETGKDGTEAAGAKHGRIGVFLWNLQKQGLQPETLRTYGAYLTILAEDGADLEDPESVKAALARKKHWNPNTKALAVAAYTKYLAVNGLSWKPPRVVRTRRLPFIPREKDIDALISGTRSKKRAAFLQLLKETGLRSGEAWRLKWESIDFEARTITFNEPEKHGKPRVFKVSPTLEAMLRGLQTGEPRIFTGDLKYFREAYLKQRKRMAATLKNPRLLRVTFHSIRHWKGSREYYKRKDILYVKELLGHRNINTTMLYTQLVQFEVDEFHTATATTVEEATKLAEAGFELFDTVGSVHIYRRPK